MHQPARSAQLLKTAMDIIESLRDHNPEDRLAKAAERLKQVTCSDFLALGIVRQGTNRFSYCDFPDQWQCEYADRKLSDIDPVLRYQARSSGAAEYWFRALRAFPVMEYAPLMEMSLDLGLRFGVCASVRDPGTGTLGVLSLSATGNNFCEDHKTLLDIVAPHLYLARDWLYVDEQPLTAREREVLRWITAGKTNWEISEILRVSENTIKFHLKSITSKLNAANRQHAVAIAMARKILW